MSQIVVFIEWVCVLCCCCIQAVDCAVVSASAWVKSMGPYLPVTQHTLADSKRSPGKPPVLLPPLDQYPRPGWGVCPRRQEGREESIHQVAGPHFHSMCHGRWLEILFPRIAAPSPS